MTTHGKRKTAVTFRHRFYRPGKGKRKWDGVFIMVYRPPREVAEKNGKKYISNRDEAAFTGYDKRRRLVSLAYVHEGAAYAIDQQRHLKAYIDACVDYRVELERELTGAVGAAPNPDHRFALLWRMGQAMDPELRKGRKAGLKGITKTNRRAFKRPLTKLSFPEWYERRFGKEMTSTGALKRLGLPKNTDGYYVLIDSALPYALVQAQSQGATLPEEYPFMSFRRGYIRALNEQGRPPLGDRKYWLLEWRVPVFAFNSRDVEHHEGPPLEPIQGLKTKKNRVVLKPLGFTLFSDYLKSAALAALHLELYRSETAELMRSYGYLKEVSRVVSYADIPSELNAKASQAEREDAQSAKNFRNLNGKCVRQARLEIKQSMSRGGTGAAYKKFDKYLSKFFDDWIANQKLRKRVSGYWHINHGSLGPYFIFGYAFRMAGSAKKATKGKFEKWGTTALKGGKRGARVSATYRLKTGTITVRANATSLSQFVPFEKLNGVGQIGPNNVLVKGVRGIELPRTPRSERAKTKKQWTFLTLLMRSEHGLIYHCLWGLTELINTVGTHLLHTLNHRDAQKVVHVAFRTLFREALVLRAANGTTLKRAVGKVRRELTMARRAVDTAAARRTRAALKFGKPKWMNVMLTTGPNRWADSVDDFFKAMEDFQKLSNNHRLPKAVRQAASKAFLEINQVMMDPKVKLGAAAGNATNYTSKVLLVWSLIVTVQAFAALPMRRREFATVQGWRNVIALGATLAYFAGDLLSAFPRIGRVLEFATVKRIERGVRVSFDTGKLKEAFTSGSDDILSSSKSVGASMKAVRVASFLQVVVASLDVGTHEYDIYKRSKHYAKLNRNDYNKRIGGGIILAGSIISTVGVFCQPIGLVLNTIGIGVMLMGNLYNYCYVNGDKLYEAQNYLRQVVALAKVSVMDRKGPAFPGLKQRGGVTKLAAAIENKGKADEYDALFGFIPTNTFIRQAKVRVVWMLPAEAVEKRRPSAKGRRWDSSKNVMAGQQIAYEIETFHVAKHTRVRFVNRSDLSKWWSDPSSTAAWWKGDAHPSDREVSFVPTKDGDWKAGTFDTNDLLSSVGELTRRHPLALSHVTGGAVSNDNKTYRYCGPYIHMPSELNGIRHHGWFYRSKRGTLKRLYAREHRRVFYDGGLQKVGKLYFGLKFYGPVAETSKWEASSWRMTVVCALSSICWSGGGSHEAAAELRLSRPPGQVTTGRYKGWCMFELDAATLKSLLTNMLNQKAPSTTLKCDSVTMEFAFQGGRAAKKNVKKQLAPSQAFVRRS